MVQNGNLATIHHSLFGFLRSDPKERSSVLGRFLGSCPLGAATLPSCHVRAHLARDSHLGVPVVPLCLFFGGGFPYYNRLPEKKRYSCSYLLTGGPRPWSGGSYRKHSHNPQIPSCFSIARRPRRLRHRARPAFQMAEVAPVPRAA